MDSRRRLARWAKAGATALLVLLMPEAARARNLCPWMNEATASGLLSANAAGTYTVAAPGQPAVCTFVATQPGGDRTLRIEVEVTATAHEQLQSLFKTCSSAVAPANAIGNEAEHCDRNSGKSLTSEFLAGRVRDQLFSITISTTLRNDHELNQGMLQAEILTAAEQVSGNLF